MTDFHVDIVRLGPIEKHPNADALDITQVHGGFPCIIKRDSFKEGDLAVYIPIDCVLPIRPEFEFLSDRERRRLKAKKLRGVFSMGLLIPVPSDVPEELREEGKDVAEALGITKYDPELASGPRNKNTGAWPSDAEDLPTHFNFQSYTDIEPLRRNMTVLQEGEMVVLQEKIHGSQSKFCHDGVRLWVASKGMCRKPSEIVQQENDVKRTNLLAEIAELREQAALTPEAIDPTTLENMVNILEHKLHYIKEKITPNAWWQVARSLDLENRLAKFPAFIFYGEVFGTGMQDLTYGQKGISFRVFDIFSVPEGRYLDHDQVVSLCHQAGLEMVPLLYKGPWKKELMELCEGTTTFESVHCREGFVVKPIKERWDHKCGRVILKCVGESYHLRKDA